MDIQEKLLKFKFHALCLALVVLLFVAFQFMPSFLSVLSFFWPLVLSTALFLAAMVVFGRTSSPSKDFSGRSAGKIGKDSAGNSEVSGEQRGLLETLGEQHEGERFMFESILEFAGGSPEKVEVLPEEHAGDRSEDVKGKSVG